MIKIKLFVLFIFLFLSAHLLQAVSEDISLFFIKSNNWIELRAINNTNKEIWVQPFKRGASAIILLSNSHGQLFPNRFWKLTPPKGPSLSGGKNIPPTPKETSINFHFITSDLPSFNSTDKSMVPATDFSPLYLLGLIKNSLKSSTPFFKTEFFELQIKNNRVSEVKEICRDAVPKEVILTFDNEIEKIQLEEKSETYGYW